MARVTADQIQRVLLELEEHFRDLDDTDDALFGEFARTSREGKTLTVLHETEPYGIAITIEGVRG